MRTEYPAPRYAGTEPLTEEMLNSMFGRERASSSTDPREAQDNYERACEAHHEACSLHKEAAVAWGQDYADDSYPVPPCPAPPCDGSSTDPWESVEALHGPLYGSSDYSFAEHCDEMGIPSGERNAYSQRLEDRHAKADADRC